MHKPTADTAIHLRNVSHQYGRGSSERLALNNLSLDIHRGEIFAFLGPNGSGKTTLFRLLSTLARLQQGEVQLLGFSLPQDRSEVRRRIGVVFQAPSVDQKLTVAENIRFQAALYGLTKRETSQRIEPLLTSLGLEDRGGDLVQTLSGGLRRRVELAKGMIHRPQMLLMDEPSTGLDPAARGDLWKYLLQLRQDYGVTVVMTTHLLEEAEKADRIGILHQGSMAAMDTPQALRASVGGDAITMTSGDPNRLRAAISEKFNVPAAVVDGVVRVEPTALAAGLAAPMNSEQASMLTHPTLARSAQGPQWIGRLMDALGDQIQSITLSKPTLEDVFIAKTGHRFWHE